MSYITYNAKGGETYEDLSRRFYGVPDKANIIQDANPGIALPLLRSTNVRIPQAAKFISKRPLSGALTDDVMVFLDTKLFSGWDQLTITESIDGMSTAAFRAPFNPYDKDQRNAFQPFSYKEVQITAGSQAMFTGTMIDVSPSSTPEKSEITIKAYATPGVLNDCCPPPTFDKLQFDKLTLAEIAATLARPYAVDVVSTLAYDPQIESVAIGTDERVLSFLIKLAKQKNALIRSNRDGALVLFNEELSGLTAANLVDGQSPLVSVQPRFGGQDYYSSITARSSTNYGDDGGSYTATNELAPFVLRPDIFELRDSENAQAKTAATGRLGKMFANTIQYEIEVATWRTPAGALWRVNDFIELLAPHAMVYAPYIFMVKEVVFNQSATEQTAKLTLILPGVMSGYRVPTVLPWITPLFTAITSIKPSFGPITSEGAT